MPLLILIGITLIIIKSAKHKPRPARKRLPSYTSTGPTQRELIQLQREQDRQQDRRRKQAEQDRKRREQEAKRQEAKQAAIDRIEWAGSMIDKYSALYEQIEQELTENTRLTQYKRIQLQKQLLQLEEKIHKYKEQQDKAYFIANN